MHSYLVSPILAHNYIPTKHPLTVLCTSIRHTNVSNPCTLSPSRHTPLPKVPTLHPYIYYYKTVTTWTPVLSLPFTFSQGESFAKRIDLQCSHHTHTQLCEVMDVFINLITVIITSQCKCISPHTTFHTLSLSHTHPLTHPPLLLATPEVLHLIPSCGCYYYNYLPQLTLYTAVEIIFKICL